MTQPSQMTRCPHCSTTFKVTHEQLSIANGIVRCGACLQVFDARSYFIHAESLAFTHQAAGGETSTTTAPDPSTQPVNKLANPRPTSTTKPSVIQKAIKNPNAFAKSATNKSQNSAHSPQSTKGSQTTTSHTAKTNNAPSQRYEDDERPQAQPENDASLAASSQPLEQKDEYDEAWAEELLRELENDDAELLEALEEIPENPLDSIDLGDDLSDELSEELGEGSNSADLDDGELDFSFFERELNNLKSSTPTSTAANHIASETNDYLDSLDTKQAAPLSEAPPPKDSDKPLTASELIKSLTKKPPPTSTPASAQPSPIEPSSTDNPANNLANRSANNKAKATDHSKSKTSQVENQHSAPKQASQSQKPAKTTPSKPPHEPQQKLQQKPNQTPPTNKQPADQKPPEPTAAPSPTSIDLSEDVVDENAIDAALNEELIQDDPIADREERPGKLGKSPSQQNSIEEAFSPELLSDNLGELDTSSSKYDQAVDESWAKSMLEELEEEGHQDSRRLSESDRLFLKRKEQLKREAAEQGKEPAHQQGKTKQPEGERTSESDANVEPEPGFDASDFMEDEPSQNFFDNAGSEPAPSLVERLKAKRNSRSNSNKEPDNKEEPDDFDEAFGLLSKSHHTNQQGSSHFLAWSLASLLLICTIFVQFLIYNFDKLSLKPTYRPLYSTACGLLNCTLPDRIATNKIINKNLVIRNHPEINGALLIDTIMVNEARFDQPFPDMTILFSDINGKAIAYRRFKPNEYKGDLTHMNKVPINTPVHISLVIKDPGENAINYSIGFKPARI